MNAFSCTNPIRQRCVRTAALGRAGGAAGEGQRPRIVLRQLNPRGARRVSAEVLVDRLQVERRRLGCDLRERRPAAGVRQDDLRLAQCDRRGQLLRRPPAVAGDQHGTEPRAGERGEHPAETVGPADGDPVALADRVPLRQRGSDPVDQPEVRCEAHPASPVEDQELPLGPLLGRRRGTRRCCGGAG